MGVDFGVCDDFVFVQVDGGYVVVVVFGDVDDVVVVVVCYVGWCVVYGDVGYWLGCFIVGVEYQ